MDDWKFGECRICHTHRMLTFITGACNGKMAQAWICAECLNHFQYGQNEDQDSQNNEEWLNCDPVPAEIEGDPSTWWYVCSECHTAVNWKDNFCRECGRRLKWE